MDLLRYSVPVPEMDCFLRLSLSSLLGTGTLSNCGGKLRPPFPVVVRLSISL